MLRALTFLTLSCAIASQLSGQVFIQAYTNEISVNPVSGEIFDCSLHILTRELSTVSIQTKVLDSSFNELATFVSPHFMIQDSLYLKEQISKFKSEESDIVLKDHGKLFIHHEIVDDNGMSLGEFLFEYIVVPVKEITDQTSGGTSNGFPIKVKGRVNATYEYNSANYPGSFYPKHLFIYDINPEVSLWNIPLRGNIRISPGAFGQYQQLSFANFQFDTDAYKRLKEESKNRIEQELLARKNELKKRAADEIRMQKEKLEQKVKDIERQLADSVKNRIPDKSFLDTLALPDTAGFVDQLVPDSLNPEQKRIDSLLTVLAALKSELDRINAVKDSLDAVFPDSLDIHAITDPSSLKASMGSKVLNSISSFELTTLSIGRFYPALPFLVGNQSSVQGLDIGFKRDKVSHEWSAGKISNLTVGQSALGMLRYSIAKEVRDNYRLKSTVVYNFNIPGKGLHTIVRNPILDIEFSKTLVKKELLEFRSEIAGAHLVVLTDQTSFQDPEQENTRAQSIVVNQSPLPGISALAALAGKAKGFEYALTFTQISERFVSVLSPYKINGLRSIEMQLKKSLVKNLVQLGLTGKLMEEGNVSKISQYKAQFKLNPRRLPKLFVTYTIFTRNYANGTSQVLNLLSAQSFYSTRFWGLLNTLQLSGQYQKNVNNLLFVIENRSLSFSDLIQLNKLLTLGVNVSANRMAMTREAGTIYMAQNSAGLNLSYMFKEWLNLGVNFRMVESRNTLSAAAGACASATVKKFSLRLAYDINSTYFGGDYFLTNQTLNRFQTILGYAF